MRKLLNNPFVSGALALGAIALVAHSLIGGKPKHRPSDLYSSQDIDYDDPAIYEDSTEASIAPVQPRFDREAILRLAEQPLTRALFNRPRTAESDIGSAESSELENRSKTLHVKGVWIQGNIRLALIDERSYQPGQSVDRIQIERIDASGVWLAHQGESYFIKPGESWTYQVSALQEAVRN
ncbi:hypothetical protein [Pelagicoccus sp. SDUM812003]|uniref:hypothetical protein n=1 Tax=Pelagicoccus sp. SDUM812003 TaxID=3041267 RepID=UPI0028101FDE|nr:hypothetical protein [Pelagicoccus sp. SDUM812003]MDQ8203037.1 hypothetical protein [Pelagicoccus sp. SDUM812003]